MADQLHHLTNIRELLQAFDDQELRLWCFDTPAFRPVYDRFSRRTGKAALGPLNAILFHGASERDLHPKITM